jgi:hypothetical protein
MAPYLLLWALGVGIKSRLHILSWNLKEIIPSIFDEKLQVSGPQILTKEPGSVVHTWAQLLGRMGKGDHFSSGVRGQTVQQGETHLKVNKQIYTD